MRIKDLILNSIKKIEFSETPQLDVELLLMNVLSCDRAYLKAYSDNEITDDLVLKFKTMLSRRISGEPVAYILGRKDFWTFSVKVSKDVLIPRPETELLVEKTLEKIKQNKNNSNNIKILDLGTGTGIISIALALELLNVEIFAVDISKSALELAKENAGMNKVENKISFHLSDMFSAFDVDENKFSYIVSNPPYIAEDDPHLNNKELQFEPKQALISEKDGLEALKEIIYKSNNFLVQGGWLLVEHGYNQVEKVRDMFMDCKYREISAYKDFYDQFRVTCGRKA